VRRQSESPRIPTLAVLDDDQSNAREQDPHAMTVIQACGEDLA
jgi:hypothetical protein